MAEGFIIRRGSEGKISDSLLNVVTATARTAITKHDPIEYRQYNGAYAMTGNTIGNIDTYSGQQGSLTTTSDGTYLLLTHNDATKRCQVFKRVGDTWVSLGTLGSGRVYSADMSPDGTMVAVCNVNGDNYIYSRSGDGFYYVGTFGPASSNWPCMRFSPDSKYLLATTSTNGLYLYKRDGYTLTYVSYVTIGGGSGFADAVWCPDNVTIIALNNAPIIQAIRRTGDTIALINGFTSQPASGISGGWYNCLSVSPDGMHVAVTSTASPFILIYKRSGDTWTKLANPSTLPTNGSGCACAYTKDGSMLVTGSDIGGSTRLLIYVRSGDTYTPYGYATGYITTGLPSRLLTSADGTVVSSHSSATPHGAMLTYGSAPFITKMASARNSLYNAQQFYGYYGMGIALESAAAGAQVKVALINPINSAVM